MPIVNNRSTIVTDPRLTEPGPDPAFARGDMTVASFSVAAALTDSSGSRYYLLDVPSDCILDFGTTFKVDLWAYADIRIGTRTDPAALASLLRSAGAIVTPLVQFDAKWAKPAWQQLGMAADPRSPIGIYAHAIAAPTVAGTLFGNVRYLFR